MPPLPPRCSIEECSGAARRKGWCLEHFRRWEKTGDPAPSRLRRIPLSATCSEDGCDKPVDSKGRCSYHYGKHHRDTAPLCAVEGCPNPRAAASHGLCQKHLYRKRRYGDPLVVQQIQNGDLKARLTRLIDRRAPEECWPWTGAVSKRGYAYTKGTESRDSHALAHRLVYETFVGPIPDGLTIDHLCHRAEECKGGFGCPHRRCCNPSHLAPEDSVANTMRGNSPSAINARKTHCQNGHAFNAVNTSVSRTGKRTCRPCRAAWKQRRRAAGLSA
ncbi:HNH endonuclease signature motif containing protein [Streptomyces sp. NPDC048445]|uniref:HNH endonuclease signature motif containing protein n=1 Tax=Streptomyces sp. NPDC048445 TaxID=3365553 RepID=UPI00371F7A19